MPAIPRQKACIACADAKRRCDKQLPECQRCLDRDVDCVYPQPKRRRRNLPRSTGTSTGIHQLGDIPLVQDPVPVDADADADVPVPGLDFVDWGAIEHADLEVSLSDMLMPYLQPEPAHTYTHVANQPAPRIALEGDDNDGNNTRGTITSGSGGAWFLGDETWVLQHNQHNKPAKTSTNVELEPFVRAVEEMLHSWVRNGHNSFIHRRLYNHSSSSSTHGGRDMPACLEDAFTTLATYVGRTPAMHDTILRIAERRSSALVSGRPDPRCASSPPGEEGDGDGGSGTQGIRAQLARVHALFVYQFVLLFDGAVRARAHAERQLPTLRRWVAQLCAAARGYRGEDLVFPQDNHQHNNNNNNSNNNSSNFDRDYETAAGLWQLWILIESVRRSQLVIDTVCNVYDALTRGWADCTGAVMFTARRGLWEADSAMRWFELSSSSGGEPLLVPALVPGPLIFQHSADEFDDFVRVVWACVIGADKMKSWVDRSSKAIRA
ncbi:uncharacterized protein F4812DRAFT_468851 [Daldinia caldariorum]|uniref:uncharacterized protein n=1 Tax=Daldinia caldariorum TaxID=326644 RepID=UPI002007E3A2|nr:uncharacterized protein F4812DRAFT_468851 [Daldinia caldariorum]KAI1463214.1 hypothetical protein F4812DRAFT_468851 [Daldinia caldariorum]